MRYIPATLKQRLMSAQQTLFNNADPRAVLWISRPGTVLSTEKFLERQTVLTGTAITSVSVAARHMELGRESDRIYLAYVDSGTAKVKYAKTNAVMASHIWTDSGFLETADYVAIAFDGTMPKADNGKVEFITESAPWVFWTASGALYGKKPGGETVTLATENCTKVSAVRAMWSKVGGFDFGLCVFFILSGAIYYRQLIDGMWTDAAQVVIGPSGVTWTDVAACRTWDYRVILQAKESGGTVYEMITQCMGIGKQNVEHIQITDIEAQGTITEIKYHGVTACEHIGIAGVTAVGEMIFGLSSAPTSAVNIDDGTGDMGKLVAVTLDYPVTDTAGNALAFTLTDSIGTSWPAQAIAASPDGKRLTVGFINFNSANGACTLSYTPGTIQSPTTAMTAWTISFTPAGLVPPQIDPPRIAEVKNV